MTDTTNYAAFEREHLGDPDKKTGIYAPKIIVDRCSHGKLWNEECPECELISAREFVKRWGPMVDEARAKIEELTKREVKT
jgi:hypothetical protein